MQRISVLNPDNSPAMPTKTQRAERWVEEGRAEWIYTDLRIKAVRLLCEPSGHNTQPIVLGIDPGKKYSGVGLVSAKCTLFTAHLVLPFELVKQRMANRAMMRRGLLGRRINRKIPFSQRAHRQKRFDNRRGKKLPPSIRANRQLELRVVAELCKLFPISQIVYEYVEATGSKSFSPVMVGQRVMLQWLSQFASVCTLYGWQTAQIRTQLGLEKQKYQKGDAIPATHAVDGVALAASQFIQYEAIPIRKRTRTPLDGRSQRHNLSFCDCSSSPNFEKAASLDDSS